ncbi:acyl carrier protein [Streptomyces fragilis]|uniref:acyl carrier protein n=1 Tax=Streptomyces fragilis TaxID=67301 RepID=UPI0024DE5377|nr:acyl carrier protein [Streptomyces fragilis]
MLFAQVLGGADTPTIDDDFFVLGGHSLRAARLTNHIADALGVRLTLSLIHISPAYASSSLTPPSPDGSKAVSYTHLRLQPRVLGRPPPCLLYTSRRHTPPRH